MGQMNMILTMVDKDGLVEGGQVVDIDENNPTAIMGMVFPIMTWMTGHDGMITFECKVTCGDGAVMTIGPSDETVAFMAGE